MKNVRTVTNVVFLIALGVFSFYIEWNLLFLHSWEGTEYPYLATMTFIFLTYVYLWSLFIEELRTKRKDKNVAKA